MPVLRNPVSRHVLDNGLTVLLREVHSAPVISWWVLYRVGSRNEQTGQTGVSHWVEHMMFKGTPRFPAGVLDQAIDREGGMWNAQTSFDYTAYYETMPASRIDLALQAEADRMQNALFDPAEVDSERTVIISERQGSENSPTFWLHEETRAAAFRVHPYHHQVIGDMVDLQSMTRDDLYNHYQTHYTPNNAIAVAVGDFDSAEMLAQIEELYGAIPPGDVPSPVARVEPPQQGERTVRVEREGNTSFIFAAYRAPEATHPDWFKMALVDSILAGASAPGGNGIGNRTSRLYKALVETELAAGVGGGLYPSVDPALFSIAVTVRDGRTIEEVQAALDAELDRLARGDITQAELDKAKKQAKALFAYGTEGVTGQAFWLAFSENFSSYEWYEHYLEFLEAVSLDEVHEAAQRYLRRSQRTLGWFIPVSGEKRA
ncbi:MAG TPA: pitrilysin family protein [Aggregatilineaceae bacterium]|nr:pitrilysin family protein [Aggregatilineaceae bacterium]